MGARNDHKTIENSQIHPPKDFGIADNGDTVRKNLNGELTWDSNPWKIQVIDLADINAAPPTEVDKDRYIVIEVASTVVNAGWDGAAIDDIVEFSDTSGVWGKYSPVEGEFAYDNDSNNLYKFNGTEWAIFGAPGSGDFSDGGEAEGTNRTLGNTDNFALAFLTNNIQRISITNAGKVGINEQTPDTQLHLTKNNADAFGQLKIEQVGSGSPSIEFLRTGVRQFNLGISAADNFFHIATGVFSSGNNKLTIDNNGNIGIGTISPITLFHLKATFPAFTIEDSDESVNEKIWQIIGNAGSLDIRTRTDGNGAGETAISISRTGANVDAVTFPSANVGINQAVPTEKLHVVGNVKVEGNVIANNLGGKTINIESPTSSEDVTMFRTDFAITVQEVIAVVIGSSPSVTYQLKHSTDRNAAGNNLTDSGSVTSTGTGDTATLSDATIPANSWIWLETTAKSGTVDMVSIDIRFITD